MSEVNRYKPEPQPPVEYVYPVGVICYPFRTVEITDGPGEPTSVSLEDPAQVTDLSEFRRRKRMQEPRFRAWHHRIVRTYLELTDPNR